MLKALLLLVGLVALGALVWHVGPARLAASIVAVGPLAVALTLLPSVPMYLLEAYGWRETLGEAAARLSFWRLFLIRTAGEVVNMTTPTAYLGGEPLKAYLLARHGIPLIDGMASVVTAKTTMTLAEIAFILLGLALAVGTGGLFGSSTSVSLGAALAAVGLLGFGLLAFLALQRTGLFMGLLRALRACRLRIPFLEARAERLEELDRTIVRFYAEDRPGFLRSTLLFFLGWLAEAVEVAAILFALGAPVDALQTVPIAALSALVKGGSFFIPGSLGAQEGGNVMLLVAFGYSEVTGLAFALLRRLREIVWIALGLIVLAALQRTGPAPGGSNLTKAP